MCRTEWWPSRRHPCRERSQGIREGMQWTPKGTSLWEVDPHRHPESRFDLGRVQRSESRPSPVLERGTLRIEAEGARRTGLPHGAEQLARLRTPGVRRGRSVAQPVMQAAPCGLDSLSLGRGDLGKLEFAVLT